ncbi:unnamed protein product [Rotaria sordida]|uniref:DHHA2 domain-containing protein n=2 Tax=Rotaria sordida TaxID=392033 RepID=A0A818L6M6_9BILA|nr:unnamed protein product [Rotaria sordida]
MLLGSSTNINQFRLIRIVLGNESCDLDSTISACVYAYFLHITCSNQNEILYLPIMNTNPSTFRLRTEIRWFLKENYSNVIFIDDINLNELYDKKKLEIILVDHHYLRSQLNKVVIEIIDHHQIKEDSIILQNSSAIKIELVGSCCTLIAEKLLTSNFQMTEEIAYLLTGPILFDTINFSPSADAKQIVTPNLRLIMSSLPTNYTVEKLIGELKTMNDINEFLLKNDNADGVIMTSVEIKNEETKRQLGFYIKKIEYIQPIYEYIQRKDLKLNLHERTLPMNHQHIKFFDQKNVHASRKQILPFIEKFIRDFI